MRAGFTLSVGSTRRQDAVTDPAHGSGPSGEDETCEDEAPSRDGHWRIQLGVAVGLGFRTRHDWVVQSEGRMRTRNRIDR
jgi:hypothetical protein